MAGAGGWRETGGALREPMAAAAAAAVAAEARKFLLSSGCACGEVIQLDLRKGKRAVMRAPAEWWVLAAA